jgi:Ca2+-transporting ATPase
VRQVAVQLPLLCDAFDTTALGLADWLICIVLASVVLWADEARR